MITEENLMVNGETLPVAPKTVKFQGNASTTTRKTQVGGPSIDVEDISNAYSKIMCSVEYTEDNDTLLKKIYANRSNNAISYRGETYRNAILEELPTWDAVGEPAPITFKADPTVTRF